MKMVSFNGIFKIAFYFINRLKYVFLYNADSRDRRDLIPVLTVDLKLRVICDVRLC